MCPLAAYFVNMEWIGKKKKTDESQHTALLLIQSVANNSRASMRGERGASQRRATSNMGRCSRQGEKLRGEIIEITTLKSQNAHWGSWVYFFSKLNKSFTEIDYKTKANWNTLGKS